MRKFCVYGTNMSDAMSSDTDCRRDPGAGEGDDGASSAQKHLAELDDKVVLLSERITLCSRLLNDFKELKKVIKRKSLQDVSLPLQK